MATEKQIFAVDTNTGQVYIQGDLFVQSADEAGDSWIVGEMISADSVINLADGAVVLDGKQGRITVYDPANHSNGNYLQIENGFVKQYENFQLVRYLVNIESGTMATDTWTTLQGTYKNTPAVLVSPANLPTVAPQYASQNQKLNCHLDAIEAIGGGKYRIKGHASLDAWSGNYEARPPAEIRPLIDKLGYSRQEQYEAFSGNSGQAPLLCRRSTATASVACAGLTRIGVTVEYQPVYEMYLYPGVFLGNPARYCLFPGYARWRLLYKPVGTSAWSYTAWDSEQGEKDAWKWGDHLNEYNVWPIYSREVSVDVPRGQYDIAAEIETYFGMIPRSWSGSSPSPLPPATANYFKIKTLSITAVEGTQLVSGSLSYTAVGD